MALFIQESDVVLDRVHPIQGAAADAGRGVRGHLGLTFLTAWFASAFDLVWRNCFAWSAGGRPLAIFTPVAAVVILAGRVRMAMAPTDRLERDLQGRATAGG
jgi:hypothetical protein